MIVNIDGNIYQMNRQQFRSTLQIASQAIPHGIYAMEKNGVCVLVKRKIDTPFYLRKQVKELEKQGFKVYWNK